ncbi:aminoglycoside phosphotransferase family protein [Candidatus Nitrospira allomarina]|uniref:Aminoglycoside phosphotransferase family protein n=1 Tax=Candidatus Nitrospira allomarina TaxID=3020900 RepID=A0AA96G9J6_9BACT|nr:aminoglycoside phosphotransferase family protein [Candidatus Nitrospira allomarina]WNM57924.1 aminoglycoside phosphotransferase family protein [Candidatus Nitrospira allomarina]
MIASTTYDRLADLVEEHGWRDGVGITLNELDPDERKALFWEIHFGAQTAWMLWVGRTDQDAVLNLDDSIGTTTVALSYLFSHVTGVFQNEAMKRCAVARAHQDGRRIEAISINGIKDQIPCQEGFFDLICLSNSRFWFESDGMVFPQGKTFLSNLLKLLTPRGMIYLGMREDPFSLRFNIGSQELCQRGLETSLEGSPWRIVTRLQFYPALGPIETVTQEGSRRSSVKGWRSTLRKIVKGESYGLILGNSWSNTSSGIIGNIASQHGVEPSDEAGISACVGTASSLVGKLPDRIVRFPLGQGALTRCRNNYETLQALQGISPVPIPAASYTGSFGSLMYFEESKLPGFEPTGEQKRAWRSDKITAQASRYLLQLHAGTAQRVILDDVLFEKLVNVPFADFMTYCKGTDKVVFTNVKTLVKKRLMGKETLLVQTHGDFKRTNLLVNETGKVIGLIDWDLSRKMGFPLMDLLWFLGYEKYLSAPMPFYQAIVRVAFEEDLLKNDCVQSYWHALCVGDGSLQKIYAAILLLYQFHEHLDYWHKTDEHWFSHTMAPILRSAFEKALDSVAEPHSSVP